MTTRTRALSGPIGLFIGLGSMASAEGMALATVWYGGDRFESFSATGADREDAKSNALSECTSSSSSPDRCQPVSSTLFDSDDQRNICLVGFAVYNPSENKLKSFQSATAPAADAPYDKALGKCQAKVQEIHDGGEASELSCLYVGEACSFEEPEPDWPSEGTPANELP